MLTLRVKRASFTRVWDALETLVLPSATYEQLLAAEIIYDAVSRVDL